MSQVANETSQLSVAAVAGRARAASRALAGLSSDCRNQALMAAARAIEESSPAILEANERDCRAAGPRVASGSMSPATFARLRLSARGIVQVAAQVCRVAELPDPLGRRLAATELDDPEHGAGVSVGRWFRNVNWVAIPGYHRFYDGQPQNRRSPDPGTLR